MLAEMEENVPANPYAYFRLCGMSFHTKPHAQMTSVMSFSLFICMVVISLYAIGSLSIFYITVGVIVYNFLMRAVFHSHAEKSSVLAYLIFESTQIVLLTALIVYLLMPILFGDTFVCSRNPYNGRLASCLMPDERQLAEERASRIQFLICFLLLTAMKFYFTRVFARFYKYLLWMERKNRAEAQYWNSRGVRINVDDVFIGRSTAGSFNEPSHVVWSNNGTSYVLNLRTLPMLPSYNQLVRNKSVCSATSAARETTANCSRLGALPPPTWDGDVSSIEMTPPTYSPQPTVTAAVPPERSRAASVLHQEIPISANANGSEPSALAAADKPGRDSKNIHNSTQNENSAPPQ